MLVCCCETYYGFIGERGNQYHNITSWKPVGEGFDDCSSRIAYHRTIQYSTAKQSAADFRSQTTWKQRVLLYSTSAVLCIEKSPTYLAPSRSIQNRSCDGRLNVATIGWIKILVQNMRFLRAHSLINALSAEAHLYREKEPACCVILYLRWMEHRISQVVQNRRTCTTAAMEASPETPRIIYKACGGYYGGYCCTPLRSENRIQDQKVLQPECWRGIKTAVKGGSKRIVRNKQRVYQWQQHTDESNAQCWLLRTMNRRPTTQR